MTQLTFESLQFFEEKDAIRLILLKIFQSRIPKEELAPFTLQKVERHTLTFTESHERKINAVFNKALGKALQDLTSIITGKKTVYVHQNSGIPLIGTNEFGLVDRDTNIIEVKPITGCNLACTYCSVNEGKDAKNSKEHDFVVESDYIIQEFAKLIKKKEKPIEANIGPQGEPLLYADIVPLVKGLKQLNKVEIISINTNGLLLTTTLIDELAEAGLDRINLSLNALDKDLASKIAARTYNMDHLLDMVQYAKDKITILLAPVIIPTLNDTQLDPIIKLAKELYPKNPQLGIQNFLNYPRGRNPVKQRSWEEFFQILEKKEKEHDVKLRVGPEDFHIVKQKILQKPFLKHDTVKVELVCPGRYPKEYIGVAQGRCVTVTGCTKTKGQLSVKIVRDKHNIFKAAIK